MNPKMLTLVFSSLLFGTLATRSQTDPFAANEVVNDAPRMIRVQAEFVEMPHATFTRLMAKPRTSANDTDLRAECAKLIESGKARIIESLNVTALPGQSATSENIREFIYPTEYEPSSFPSQIRPNLGPLSQGMVGGPPPPPHAFDTKNTGSTFEVEAQIDANLPIVELRFTPTLVHHTGQDVWGVWERNGVKVETSMPRFYILSVKTGVSVAAGQPHMVAGLSPRSEDGWMDSSRKVMTFVRADIITIGK